MTELKRTDSTDKDFRQLVELLDKDLTIRDGDDHSFYHQFNTINTIKHCIGKPVACGALREYTTGIIEIKRMYTIPEARGKGIATQILSTLENWAKDMGYKECILETGKKQPEAIFLYQKNNYQTISNYGQYKNVENSVCMRKYV